MMEFEDPLVQGLDANDVENISVRFNPARGYIGVRWKPLGQPERMRILRVTE